MTITNDDAKRSDSREAIVAIARKFGDHAVDLDDLIAAYRIETCITLNWYFVEATLAEQGWVGIGDGLMASPAWVDRKAASSRTPGGKERTARGRTKASTGTADDGGHRMGSLNRIRVRCWQCNEETIHEAIQGPNERVLRAVCQTATTRGPCNFTQIVYKDIAYTPIAE